MDILQTIHGLIRWPILLVLAAGLARALVGLRRAGSGKLERTDRALGSILVGALDAQVVLGLILLFVNHAWSEQRAHIGLMFSSLLVAHGFLALAKRRPGRGVLLMLFGLPAVLILWGLRLG